MAKENSSITFKNATIDTSDMTITELGKEDSYTFNIMDILNKWNGVDGLTISIKRDVVVSEVEKTDEDTEE